MHERDKGDFLSAFSLCAVAGASVGVGSVAVGLAWYLIRSSRSSSIDKAVVFWLLYDAITHLTLVSLAILIIVIIYYCLGSCFFVLFFDWNCKWS